MDKIKQRIAIAEYCGWRGFEMAGDEPIGVPPQNEITEQYLGPRTITNWTPRCPVLDYLTDLNAMFDAEKFLDTTNGGPTSADCLRYAYSNVLYKLCPEWIQPFRAPANLRAEAFLKTIGKWEE